jgi:BNR repeat-containing family member
VTEQLLHSVAGDGLLQQALSRWQFGDWLKLSQMDEASLPGHPDRAALSLLSAAGHFQLGHSLDARRLLALAEQFGVDMQLLGLVLASGVFNSLGRAAALLGEKVTSKDCLESASKLIPLTGDLQLWTQARQRMQWTQLGLPPDLVEQWASVSSQPSNPLPPFQVKRAAAIDLGLAWSGNTVNTVVFRHHGVMTWADHQYAAFYVDERRMRVVRRHLVTDDLDTCDIDGEYNLRDAHNSISMGIDRTGHIHISYDHHASRLRYRRSSHPESITEWTEELPMTGVAEEKVTYPTFILPRGSHPLTLLYRDGSHNMGSARLKTYDEQTRAWSDRPVPILSGSDQRPWTSNAYWNHPVIGSDGSLHLSFVWRTGMLGIRRLVNNINIGYAWSPDNGLNWFTCLGQPYRLPITQVNAEVVWPISPGSNLINQTSMALDSADRPHIVFYANDAEGIPQYQRVWFDGHQWRQQAFTRRTMPFDLMGRGTLQIPISRPEILIDAEDRVYAIGRGDFSQDRMVIMRLDEAQQAGGPVPATREIWPEPLGFSEPVLDRTRWVRDQVLTLFLQRADQPSGDLFHEGKSDRAWLVDVEIPPT